MCSNIINELPAGKILTPYRSITATSSPDVLLWHFVQSG